LKPSRWTNASLYASPPEKINNQIHHSTGLAVAIPPVFYDVFFL
jgi:hypothetical protein